MFMNQMAQQGGEMPEIPLADTSEQIYISALALIKMLKHGNYLLPKRILPSTSPQVEPAFLWKSWA